jgi:hypothetical protein
VSLKNALSPLLLVDVILGGRNMKREKGKKEQIVKEKI